MATTQQITDSIALANAYFIQLLNKNTTGLQSGALTHLSKNIFCLRRFIRALQWDVDDNINDADTTALYDLLLTEIDGYTGSGVVVDPNVIIPGQPIIVIATMPVPLEIGFGDMTLAGTRYDNPLWSGFNPFMIVDNTTWLEKGVDYNLLPSGGFTLIPGGNMPAIFQGQIIRALTYVAQ